MPVRRAIAAISIMTIVCLVSFVYSYSKGAVKDYYSTGPGEMGPTVLEPGKMTVEVDYQPGYAPHDDALAQFRSRAENYSGRSVELLKTGTAIPAMQNVTIENVVSYEREFRRSPPVEGDRVSLYVIYVGGKFSENSNVLAATYLSLSIVVFKSEIVRYAPQGGMCDDIMIVNECKVERSALVHEFGHVLGLVGLVYASPADHEDPQHPSHCTNESCVMHHSIDVYKGGIPRPPPYAFDRDCLEDLKAIRASSYGKYYLKDPRFDAVVVIIAAAGVSGIAAVVLWDRRRRKASTIPQVLSGPATPP
jgi:hypothetical protein